jgi:hypothetical protein
MWGTVHLTLHALERRSTALTCTVTLCTVHATVSNPLTGCKATCYFQGRGEKLDITHALPEDADGCLEHPGDACFTRGSPCLVEAGLSNVVSEQVRVGQRALGVVAIPPAAARRLFAGVCGQEGCEELAKDLPPRSTVTVSDGGLPLLNGSSMGSLAELLRPPVLVSVVEFGIVDLRPTPRLCISFGGVSDPVQLSMLQEDSEPVCVTSAHRLLTAQTGHLVSRGVTYFRDRHSGQAVMRHGDWALRAVSWQHILDQPLCHFPRGGGLKWGTVVFVSPSLGFSFTDQLLEKVFGHPGSGNVHPPELDRIIWELSRRYPPDYTGDVCPLAQALLLNPRNLGFHMLDRPTTPFRVEPSLFPSWPRAPRAAIFDEELDQLMSMGRPLLAPCGEEPIALPLYLVWLCVTRDSPERTVLAPHIAVSKIFSLET